MACNCSSSSDDTLLTTTNVLKGVCVDGLIATPNCCCDSEDDCTYRKRNKHKCGCDCGCDDCSYESLCENNACDCGTAGLSSCEEALVKIAEIIDGCR